MKIETIEIVERIIISGQENLEESLNRLSKLGFQINDSYYGPHLVGVERPVREINIASLQEFLNSDTVRLEDLHVVLVELKYER